MGVINQIMSRVAGGRTTGRGAVGGPGRGVGTGARTGTGTGTGLGTGMGTGGARRSQDEAIGRGVRKLFRRFR